LYSGISTYTLLRAAPHVSQSDGDTSGKQEFARPVDFPNEGDDGIFDMNETGSFRWTRLRVIFSFSFTFLTDTAKRFSGDKKED